MSQTNPQGSVDEILDRFRKWPSSDYKTWHEENDLKIAQARIEIMHLIEAATRRAAVEAYDKCLKLAPDVIGMESGFVRPYQDGYNTAVEEYAHRIAKSLALADGKEQTDGVQTKD